MRTLKIRLGPAGIGGVNEAPKNLLMFSNLGLNAAEVAFTYSIYLNNQNAKRIGQIAKKLDVKLSIHAPYYVNLASEEEKKIEASKKRILDSCERAHFMEASPVVFHPAYFGKKQKQDVFDMTKEAMSEMNGFIKKKRWNTELAPEITGKHSALGSLEETIELVKETKSSICVDLAHLFARNRGAIDFAGTLDAIESLKFKHIHFHFSGINFTLKGEKNHVPMGQNPDFRPFAEELLKRKQNCTIISESPITWKDSLKMKEIFEELGYKI